MSFFASLLGRRPGRRSRHPEAHADTRVVFAGRKFNRIVHHGPLSAPMQSVAYVGITGGHAEIVVSLTTDGGEQFSRPSARLPAPFDPVFAFRLLQLVELHREWDIDAPDLFQRFATAYSAVHHPEGAPEEVMATHQNVRTLLGEAAFDVAVHAWPSTQDVEQAIIACSDAGVAVDLDAVSDAVLRGPIAPNAWLIEHGVEAPDVRRARLAEEEAFVAGLRGAFDAVLAELGHKPGKARIAELNAAALRLRTYGVGDRDLLVGIPALRLCLAHASHDMLHDMLERIAGSDAGPDFLLGVDASLGGCQLVARALDRAAAVTAKAVPEARPQRELRWAIIGQAVDAAAQALNAGAKEGKK